MLKMKNSIRNEVHILFFTDRYAFCIQFEQFGAFYMSIFDQFMLILKFLTQMRMIFFKLYQIQVTVSMDPTQFNSTIQDLMIEIDNFISKELIGQDTYNLKKCVKNFKNKLSLRNSIDYLFSKENYHKILHLLQQNAQSSSNSSNEIGQHDYEQFGIYNPVENKENVELKNCANQSLLNQTIELSMQNQGVQNNLNNQLLELKKLLMYIFQMKSSEIPIIHIVEECHKCQNQDCTVMQLNNFQAKWAQYKIINKPEQKIFNYQKHPIDKNCPIKQLVLFLLTVEEITERMFKICKDVLYDLTSISDISCVNSKNTQKRSLLTEMLKESQERNAQIEEKSIVHSLNEYRIQSKRKARSHRTILMEIEQNNTATLRKKEIIPKKNKGCGACSQCIIF